MLEKSFKTLNNGDKVTGIVASIGTNEITVDLGTKHSGYIPISELTDDPDVKPEDIVKVGQEIETFVIRVNDVEGTVQLSKKRLDSVKNWDSIEAAKEDKVPVEGLVTEENKGGIVVNVKGIRVFVPASQTGLPKGAPMTSLVKTKVQLRITEGYMLARALGHTIKPLSPSLVPLTSEDPDCAAMQGLSLRNVQLTLHERGGRALWSALGELQFTHFGVTGPLVLSASAHMEEGRRYTLEIDLKPGLPEEKLDARLLRDLGENNRREFKNALDALLPRSLIPVVIRRSGIPPETRAGNVTRIQRQALLQLLKHFTLEISGMRPVEEAVITRGGVDVKEVNPSTAGTETGDFWRRYPWFSLPT